MSHDRKKIDRKGKFECPGREFFGPPSPSINKDLLGCYTPKSHLILTIIIKKIDIQTKSKKKIQAINQSQSPNPHSLAEPAPPGTGGPALAPAAAAQKYCDPQINHRTQQRWWVRYELSGRHEMNQSEAAKGQKGSHEGACAYRGLPGAGPASPAAAGGRLEIF